MTMGKRGWFLALLVLIFAGGGCWLAAAGEDDAEPSWGDAGFLPWFFAKNGLDKLRDAQTVYPASVRGNLAHAAALSTKDYLLVSSRTKTGMLAQPKSESGPDGSYYFDRWKVVDVTPANYGAVAAELNVLACPDSRNMINRYCAAWHTTNMGIAQHLQGWKRNDDLRLGDLALCSKWLDIEKFGIERTAVEFFRNGVVVMMAYGQDSGNFRYLRFLRDLDALLSHDGANPPPAPGGLSEGEYRAAVEKYQAWREEEAKKEAEKRAREWARRQAGRAPAPGEPRGDASADCACPAPAPRAQAPQQGGHWLWRLLTGCGRSPRAGE